MRLLALLIFVPLFSVPASVYSQYWNRDYNTVSFSISPQKTWFFHNNDLERGGFAGRLNYSYPLGGASAIRTGLSLSYQQTYAQEPPCVNDPVPCGIPAYAMVLAKIPAVYEGTAGSDKVMLKGYLGPQVSVLAWTDNPDGRGIFAPVTVDFTFGGEVHHFIRDNFTVFYGLKFDRSLSSPANFSAKNPNGSNVWIDGESANHQTLGFVLGVAYRWFK